ncbi:MAG: HRDC domain-containing protein [Bacteroidales bacterium]|jgi:ATP-dependent DNA helicase RecQ|nr:HRDC domain-containing protein [Bacteroidales bacterium]
MHVRLIGNKNLLQNNLIGFLSSRKISNEEVILCKQWVYDRIKLNETIVCGNITDIEKDIVEALLDNSAPFVLVLATGFSQIFEDKIQRVIKSNKILVASVFDDDVIKFSSKTAYIRNKLIIRVSNQIFVGSLTKGGNLDKILQKEIYSKIPQSIIKISNKKKELPKIKDKKLFELLRQWRLNKSMEQNMPPYIIFSQRALIEISNNLPQTIDEMLVINGVGQVNSAKYGNEVLTIIKNYNKA